MAEKKTKKKNRKALEVTENSLVIDLSHKSVVRTFHSYIVSQFLLFPSLQTISRLFFHSSMRGCHLEDIENGTFMAMKNLTDL